MTPRRIRLTRAADLRGLHGALAALCLTGDIERTRSIAVILPSRSAAAQFRATLETLTLEGGTRPAPARVLALPDLLTRSDWYRRLHRRLGSSRPLLSALEREVLLNAAAREAVAQGAEPPFRMRPGLVAEMLAFFDGLLRQRRTIDRFEALITEDLSPRAEFDRGAERLLRQTRFLVATYRNFERRVAESGGLDEHALRHQLLEHTGRPLFREVVVAVGDRAADPAGGLFPADFDLLTRLPNLEAVEIVASERMLASGFGERLHDMLPGLEEVSAGDRGAVPYLLAPDPVPARLFFTSRDREEELRATTRRMKAALRTGSLNPGRAAIVFSRPLPYVYLAQTVLDAAAVECQLSDALPLAAEPFAALLEQLFAAVATRFSRPALVALLRSPHLSFPVEGDEPTPEAIDEFDRALREAGYLGDPRRLERLIAGWTGALALAGCAASRLCAGLAPLASASRVSVHIATLSAFLDAHERPYGGPEEARARHLRARAAVRAALDDLRAASLRHDDPEARLENVAATIRRWLESQTFAPRRGAGGVLLVDARAARFGDFDAVHLAGLVEGEWPEPVGRNIFYPPFLLSQLGWPPDAARVEAARADFNDLLLLARHETSVSTFALENDTIVEPSPLLEDLEGAQLEVRRVAETRVRVFADEALSLSPPAAEAVGGAAAAWLDLRVGRTPASAPGYHGSAGAARVPAHSVSAIDRYLDCPFKYFAATVLRLPEDLPDATAMSPKAQGLFVHEVFRAFFAGWQLGPGGAITPARLDAARALFAEVASEHLALLPEGEAALERMRLLGSPASAGFGEIVFAAEAVRAVPVRERLLEYPIEGEFRLAAPDGDRTVRLRGKADRVDLLEDRTLRVIDYKSGRAPEEGRSVQLPIYAICVQQQLRAVRGETWGIAEASYVAFGEREPLKVVIDAGPDGAAALADGQARLLDAVDRIDCGEFPARPASTRLCAYCAYAAVCRKDYVTD